MKTDTRPPSKEKTVKTSGVASPEIWGAKIFDFRQITPFCLEKCLSTKHKNEKN